MKITSIRKNYIQKSRIFLYPLLNIRRGVSVTPVQTYLTWDNVYTVEDCKLIAVYHLRDDKEFKDFEEKKLFNNDLFDNFFELEDGKGAYVFDFSKYKKEFQRTVAGRYSEIDEGYKRKILNFFRNHQGHHRMIESYVNPHLYFEDYAELLKVPIPLLKEVGELCSLPDLKKEMLEIKKKVLNFTSVNNL